jgi:hypothetical protein
MSIVLSSIADENLGELGQEEEQPDEPAEEREAVEATTVSSPFWTQDDIEDGGLGDGM